MDTVNVLELKKLRTALAQLESEAGGLTSSHNLYWARMRLSNAIRNPDYADSCLDYAHARMLEAFEYDSQRRI